MKRPAAQRLAGDLLDRQLDQLQDPQHVGAARAIHVAHRDRARRTQAGHLLGKELKLLVDRLGMVGIGAQPRQQRPIDQTDDRHRQIAAQRRPLALSQIGQRGEFTPVALRADKLRRAHPALFVVEVGVFEEDFGDAAHRGRFPGPRAQHNGAGVEQIVRSDAVPVGVDLAAVGGNEGESFGLHKLAGSVHPGGPPGVGTRGATRRSGGRPRSCVSALPRPRAGRPATRGPGKPGRPARRRARPWPGPSRPPGP